MSKIKIKKVVDYIKNHKVISIISFLILLSLVWYIYKNSSESVVYTETAVSRGSISEMISVTGNVKPLSSVDLAFERGGRVANINVSVGDKVYAGQSLLSVSNGDLVADVDQAKANLKRVQAQLDELKKGTRTEQLSLQYTKVDKATSDLVQAKVTLINTLNDSYTKVDDAIRNKIDIMFVNPRSKNAQLIFQTDSQLKNDIEQERIQVEDALVSWNKKLVNLSDSSDLNSSSQTAKNNLDLAKKLLENLGLAVNNLYSNSSLAQATIDGWKLNVSTARSSVAGAISSLLVGIDQYNAAASGLKLAQDELKLEQAGATTEQLTAQEASVEQAAAQVDSAQAQLAKSIVRSPIDGVVTALDAKLGEIVSANKNVVSVISYGDYEVESYVPEADIAKVKIGNTAKTTLDAYGSDASFETSVIKVDPAATVIDGVPTYKVTLKFTNKDEKVRSGMTANLDILTNKKDGVLILPNRLIISKDDGKYVSVLETGDKSDLIEKKIITGLRGTDGNIEIISGLNEGDKVVQSTVK